MYLNVETYNSYTYTGRGLVYLRNVNRFVISSTSRTRAPHFKTFTKDINLLLLKVSQTGIIIFISKTIQTCILKYTALFHIRYTVAVFPLRGPQIII